MLIACWSPKGGSGTTVLSVGLALVMARWNRRAGAALLADLAGDVPAVLGLADPTGPGLADWLAAGADVPAGALGHLEMEVAPGLSVLPVGSGPAPTRGDRGDVLARLLAADGRPVVADCGPAATAPTLEVAGGATLSIAVVRPCYLALRRVLAAPVAPSAVVLVEERERSLGAPDVEEVLGVPVVARVPCDPAISRSVDAGSFGTKLPRSFDRALRPLVADLLGSPAGARPARRSARSYPGAGHRPRAVPESGRP